MKSRLVLDQDADVTTATEAYRKKIRYVARDGRKGPVAIYPKDTEFDGEHAVLLVKTGQAVPVDDECRKACGMSADQIDAQQVNYQMDSIGIHDPEAREMYRGGIISGIDPETGEYIPGPAWESYHAAIKALEDEDEK